MKRRNKTSVADRVERVLTGFVNAVPNWLVVTCVAVNAVCSVVMTVAWLVTLGR